MVLISICWISITFFSITLGIFTNKVFQLKNTNFVIFAILGLFTTTLFASIWAIFGRINLEFHTFYLIFNLGLSLYQKKEIKAVFIQFIQKICSLSKSLKIVISTITLLTIAQCASIPYVLDNESYYIQTIKWINEYGFVKGLANLHIFLAQTSGWHVLQSVFNYSFIYDNFNDLSGYCLWLVTLFSILKLDEYFKNLKIENLIIGLLSLANVFLFQFISAPSPDIPVYLFSFLIFYYFIQNFNNITIEKFNLIVILVLFTLYIKTTSIVLIFIPITLLLCNFKKLFPKLLKSVLVSAIILVLFGIKNLIINGYPFFPLTEILFFETDYKLPEIITNFFYQETKVYGYLLTYSQYETISFYSLIKHWLTLPKLHGLFNIWSILLVIIIPILIYKYYNIKSMWFLYFFMCFQLVILLYSSPQYRFFFNFLMFFSLFLVALLIPNKKHILLSLHISLIVTSFVLLVPIKLNSFTSNTFALSTSTFKPNTFLLPYKSSKFLSNFEMIELGNLHYFSPKSNSFFWSSGDGNLPCVNKSQIEYFRSNFHLIPQLRTTKLKDGFYSKNTSKL